MQDQGSTPEWAVFRVEDYPAKQPERIAFEAIPFNLSTDEVRAMVRELVG